jgi:hydrogenase maturation protease
MRIIGCGNRARMDDGVGVVVAERLRKVGIDVVVESGEALALIDSWKGENEVVLVDAVSTGAPPGTVHTWNDPHLLSLAGTPSSTHGFGVAEAVELAWVLGRLPRKMLVYGIEGKSFKHGYDISHELQPAIEEVVQRITAYVSGRRMMPGKAVHHKLQVS